MSNAIKTARSKSRAKSLANPIAEPSLPVPNGAPPMPFDVSNPKLSLDDILPSQFLSLETLQAWCRENGEGRRAAIGRMVTITEFTPEIMYGEGVDREKNPELGQWKWCIHFEEIASLLVINKTRGGQLTELAGGREVARWMSRLVGESVLLVPGIHGGHAQIGIEALGEEEAQLDNDDDGDGIPF